MARVEGVLSVHDLHVWTIGTERVALSAHVAIERLDEWPAILYGAQELLRARYGIDHVTLQPEPALKRPSRATVTVWPRGQRPT
jgi:cobalt-zinc-cadmium efflux system protein